MSGRIQRGWSIAKASWAVLVLHPRLLILPAISAATIIAALAVLASMFAWQAGGLHLADGRFPDLVERYWDDHTVMAIAGLALAGYVLTAASVFFNVALIFCVLRCFASQTPSIRAGLAAAVNRLPQILGWAFVALVVGTVISLVVDQLKDRLGFLGSLLGGLLDFAWAVMTYFVLPVLVVEGPGPIVAVKRSSSILRQTWGESLVGNFGLGLVGFLLALPGLALLAGGIGVIAATDGSMAALGIALIAVGVLAILAASVIAAMLGSIFQTGVYIYATTGQAPLDEALLKETFQPKPAKEAKSWTRWFRG